MSRSPRRPVVPAVSALSAVLLAAVWVLMREPAPLQVGRMPDGGVIRLEAVTYGSEHRFVKGRNWRRLLVPLLPERLREGIGGMHQIEKDSPSLVFWITRLDARLSGMRAEPYAEIFDEHGCKFPAGSSPVGPPVIGETVEAWSSQAFPRRGKKVGLRIFPIALSVNAVPAAEFIVPNPNPGNYPQWKGASLPATRRDGDLEVTLTRVETGLRDRGPVRAPAARGPGEWTCGTARITRNGRLSKLWKLMDMTLSDATGNLVRPIGMVPSGSAGETHFVFLGGLFPDEAAWKVRVKSSRAAGFPPADLWTVRGIAIPPPGGVTRSTAATTRHGVSLRLLGISGTGTQLLDEFSQRPGVPGSSGAPAVATPTVHLMAKAPGDHGPAGNPQLVTLVRAVDDQGRDAKPGSGSVSSGGEHSFDLRVPAGAKTLDLTFAVPESRFAEFLVKPTGE